MSIPSSVEDLTPTWFSQVLNVAVSSVDILDAHSGTTGRALVRLGASADVPPTLFVKLQPFTSEQRAFLRHVGMGVAEARLYATIGNELPVRAPRVWHADYDSSDGSFIMVLEDLQATGCRFPAPSDSDILDVAASTMQELANLHATYQGRSLPWVETPSRKPVDAKKSEKPAGGAQFIKMALDQFGDEMPAAFSQLAQLYIDRGNDIAALFNEGDHTLIHGDAHFGNLFVDGKDTGFFDWAVASRAPGMRDIAYFLCNSVPAEMRRAEQEKLLGSYLSSLLSHGITLDKATANEQYRLFSVYSWIAATSTAAMGSKWQPIEIGHAAMVRTTEAINDLDAVGLLEERLA
jgi:thiamine kinase-like enzyme